MTTGTISSLGVGSGLELQSILDQLREVDSQLIERKKNDVTAYETQLNEFTTVNNKLLSLKSNALDLSLSSTYLGRTITSSDEKVLTATVSDGTTVQSDSITVDRIASKSSWISAGATARDAIVYVPTTQQSTTGVADAAVDSIVTTDGSLVLAFGDTPTPITVAVTSGMTMNDVVTAINTDAENVGGGANGRLVTASTYTLNSETFLRIETDTVGGTGETNRVAVTSNGTDLTLAAPSKTLSYSQDGNIISLDIAADTTMEQLVAQINDDTNNPGVTASIIDDGSGTTPYRLVLQANETGSDQEIALLSQMPDLALSVQGSTGSTLNAQIQLDGITYQRQNNSINDVISGVTMSLQSAGSASISVSNNSANVKEMVTAMVTAYNDLVQEISTNSNYDETTESFGTLSGTTIRDIPNLLGSIMSTTVAGSDDYISYTYDAQKTEGSTLTKTDHNVYSMFDIGMELNRDGTITMDSSVLDSALSVAPGAVQNFFLGVNETTTIPVVPTYQASTTGVDNSFTDSVVPADGTLVIAYGENGASTITVDIGPTAGVATMDHLVTAINGDTENVGTGINGRMVTASTYDVDGKTYLKIASDTANPSGEANRVAITTNDTSLTFSAPTERYETTDIKGFADTVNDFLRELTGATGQVAAEKTAAQQRIDDLNLKIAEDTTRLDNKYDLLAKQFVQLDRYMNQMTSISSYLTGQFTSISDGWGKTGTTK